VNDLLQALQEWYSSNCNGDWEHSFGVKVETLDNPGWLVTIDLAETEWEQLSVDRQMLERNETDWISTEVAHGKFIGAGGPHNLAELLRAFLQLVAAGDKEA
jgi:hypothetical protein